MYDDYKAARGLVYGVIYGAVIWLFLILIGLLIFADDADASVVLTPPKHIVTTAKPSGRWMLFNAGDVPVIYELTTTNLMAHEADRSDICQHLLFAPRRIELAPGERQVVRFLFKKIPGGPGNASRAACRVKFEHVDVVGTFATGTINAQAGVVFQLSFTSAIYVD